MGVGEILHPFYYQQSYQHLFKCLMLQQNNVFYHVNYVKIKIIEFMVKHYQKIVNEIFI